MNTQISNTTLARENIEIIEHERSKIAHDLHNDLGQNITAIRVAAQLMCRQSEGRQTYPVAKSIVMLTDQMFDVMHQLLRRLDPNMVENKDFRSGLNEMLAFVEEHMQLICQVRIQGEVSCLDKPLQLAVYRIIQEALTNAVRHGHAKHARIKLAITHAALEVSISNDGRALTSSLPALLQDKKSGLGLSGIQQRVLAWQGHLAFENTDQGVQLSCMIPLAL